MPHVSLNGQEIYYEDTGGDRPVVVFSHGFLMDRSMFDAQIEVLSSQFRCVSFDQRGFGQTKSDGQAFSYWDSAQDLLGLLAHLGIQKAVLAGLSQGAFISMRAALLASEQVAGLVLISTRSGLDTEEQNNNFRQLAQEWTLNGSANLGQMLSGLLIGDERHGSPWMAKWSKMARASLTLPVNALVGRDDLTARLAEIGAPTLVIHGSADVAIDVSHGRKLAAGIKDAVFVEIHGAGHAPPITHSTETSQAILQFLTRLTDGQSKSSFRLKASSADIAAGTGQTR